MRALPPASVAKSSTANSSFTVRLWWLCELALFCLAGAAASAATVPAGFSESMVAGGLHSPTAMAFAPDGRLFVCEQGGQLRVIRGGALLPAPFATLTVDSTGERGLLGVTFDPSFPTNHFVYVYYTATLPIVHNRVSRFTANGDVAVTGSEAVLVDLEPLGATNHNGGAIHFGLDGKLYVAVGENANGSNSQSLSNRLGKILRVNPDGGIPTDNPFYTTAAGVNRSIWALGLRNPFTFAFQSFTGTMFINDVGQNTWEEIDQGRAGANYGWPVTEGFANDPRFQDPLYAYDHSNGACAISGGAFYTPLTTRLPAQYAGAYFFGDYCGGWIRWRASGNGAVTNFADGITFLVDLAVSQDGQLYYLARGSGAATGVVARIDYAGAPTVSVTANGTHGSVALAPGDPLKIVVSFTLGNSPTLNPAEIYVGVSTRFGTFWMDPITRTFVPTLAPVYAGPLTSFAPTTVVDLPNLATLPAGDYGWIVVVDNDSNGIPNGTFYDVATRTTVP